MSKPLTILSRLEKDDIISNDTTDTLGRMQKMSYVSEAGLYELIFASKKLEAREFKKWLCKGEHNINKATAEACRIGWFVNDISIYEVNGRKKTSEYGKFTLDGLVGIYDTFKK